jgi:hypothetical protein
MSEGRLMNRPQRGPRPTAKARRWAAVFAATILVAVVGAWVGGEVRRYLASRRLLAPIIKYHESRYALNLKQSEWDTALAKNVMRANRLQLQDTTRALVRAMSMPEEPRPFKEEAWRRLRFEARGLIRNLSSVADRLWDASLHEKLAAYHLHAKRHYEQLLRARALRLPPLPAELMAEEQAIEAGLRRRFGNDSVEELEIEPPAHLIPWVRKRRTRDQPATPIERMY